MEKEELEKRNRELSAFIIKLADKNNTIWLENGRGYRLNKVLKGDWVRYDG